MNFLEIFFVVSGCIILLLALDIARKEKFNALHFLVFLGIGSGLLVFTFFPGVLSLVGAFFGLQRGADALVYTSIIFLIYFVLLLLTKVENNKHTLSKIIREMAISQSSQYVFSGNEVIFIRMYNEEKVIQETLNTIWNAGYKNILVVNDGSTDQSLQETQKFAQGKESLVIISHFKNRGGGAAMETGFEYLRRFSQAKFVVCFDADGQHDVQEISHFFSAFQKHPQIQIFFGSRFLKKDSSKNIPFTRKMILKAGMWFTFLLSGIKLTDSHNGFRVMKTEILPKLQLTADSMAYASEITEMVKKYNIAYGEIPVHIYYTSYSLGKGQKSSNAIFIGLHMIWTKFFR